MLTAITWNIDPEIFSLGPLSIRYYGLLFATAFMIDYAIFKRFFQRDNLPIELLDKLTMWAVVSTIVGLRLGHCLFYDPIHYLSNPLEMLKVWEGGLASHGAAIGVPLGLYFFTRKYKMNYLWLLDRIVIVVALTGCLIRLGNLMNSEIYGHATQVPWAFHFITNMEVWRSGGAAVYSAPSHPTQIYESLAYLIIFFVLYYLFNRKANVRNRGGFLFGLFLVLVFAFRFCIEFIKNTQVEAEQGMLATIHLNMGQMLSIPFVLLGIGLIVYSLRHPLGNKPFVGNATFVPKQAPKAKANTKSRK